MTAYADTSVLGRVYFQQADSAKAIALVRATPLPLPFTPLHNLEIRNAVRLRVYRAEADAAQRDAILAAVDADLAAGVLHAVPLPWAELMREAERLSAAHTGRLGCRSLDVLHVAAAVTLGAREFLTFDTRQAALAKTAGLKVKP
jgi:predicted nucleic acid-binding protein